MLLQFSVNNFRSIKDTAIFKMVKTAKDKQHFSEIRKFKVLKTAVIYGANASGKSNVLKAMSFMRFMVLNRGKVVQSTDKLRHEPFLLNTETETNSSSFEIIFIFDEVKYRYGFEADNTQIYAEWLYSDEKGKEAKLFFRDYDEDDYVNSKKFEEGINFYNALDSEIDVPPNYLFIWKCDQQKTAPISRIILHWFENLNLLDGTKHNQYKKYAMKQIKENKDFNKSILSLVKAADIGISRIGVTEEPVSNKVNEMVDSLPLPDDLKKEMLVESSLKSINTYHYKYNDKYDSRKEIEFQLDKQESIGTQKFFQISAPILNTLKEGKILLVDELDSSLHPELTRVLIHLFHNKSINKNNAQLIFNTHDQSLLNNHTFERGQIWFTSKNQYGETEIYSLAQFKGERRKPNIASYYASGDYGAVPYLDLSKLEIS